MNRLPDNFTGNPFLDPLGHEGNSTTGDRLEKVQTFTVEQCDSALMLESFCLKHGLSWLQVAVAKAIQKRLRDLTAKGDK